MGKYKRYKNSIEKFLSGDSGKRFFNFAYSIGAAIVIWGALFKILHLPGGNVMLSIGMGVEVVMFILTAFDRPAKEYHWEEVFPVLASKDPEDRPDFKNGGGIVINGNMAGENGIAVSGAEARRIAGIPSNIEVSEEDTQNLSNSIQKLSAAADQISPYGRAYRCYTEISRPNGCHIGADDTIQASYTIAYRRIEPPARLLS